MTEIKLPDPDTHCYDDDVQPPRDVWSYSADLVRQIIEADRAQRGENYKLLTEYDQGHNGKTADEMYSEHVESDQLTQRGELDKCPFCGAKQGFFMSLVLTLAFWRSGWFVECWKCGARGPMRVTKDRAKASWNTRSNAVMTGPQAPSP